jgi:RimJ/RimL family protein N-acetyltransferase
VPEDRTTEEDRMLAPFGLSGRHARLEPMTEAHVPRLAAAAAEDRATYAFTRVPRGGVETAEYVRAALAEQAEGRALPWVVRRCVDDAVVGSTRYLDMELLGGAVPVPDADHPPSVLEIGNTWYAASAQRTAINTEVKLLLLTQAFDVWDVVRVTLKTDARNARSRAAIERLGARFEGIRRAHTLAVDGTVRDSAYYSIVRAEWPNVRSGLLQRLDPRPATLPL